MLVDVVVTNSKGQPVKALQQRSFQVFDNGQPQAIRSFSFVGSAGVQLSPQPENQPHEVETVANTFTNFSPVPDETPLNVIVWDTTMSQTAPANTRVDYAALMLSARLQLIHFLQHKPPQARYAIFLMAGGVKMLQGFTDNADQLVAAMQRPETAVVGTWNMLVGEKNPFPFAEPSAQVAKAQFLSGVRGWYQAMGMPDSFFETGGRMHDLEHTLGGLQQLAFMLSGLPGRKNVFWLTSSLPWDFTDDSEPLRQMTATLTPSRIALYPIDWRGLTIDPTFDVSTNLGQETNNARSAIESLRRLHEWFSANEAGRHAVLDLMAEQTGGKAFYNTNDLGKAILAASADGSDYYTLTYALPKPPRPGELRRIRVTLRPNPDGYHLSYRRTYYTGKTVVESDMTIPPPDPVAVAGQHGAPPAQGLVFTVSIHRIEPGSILPMQQSVVSHAASEALTAGPARSYIVHYRILRRYIGEGSDAAGQRVMKLECAGVVFDEEGNSLNGVRSTVTGALRPDTSDLDVDQRISIPSGASWLRMVVHDYFSGRIGSLELPVQALGDRTTTIADE